MCPQWKKPPFEMWYKQKPTSKLTLVGNPHVCPSRRAQQASMKKQMKAAGLDIAWTPRATAFTGQENSMCQLSGISYLMQLCQFNSIVWLRGEQYAPNINQTPAQIPKANSTHTPPNVPLQTCCKASNLRPKDMDNALRNHQHMSVTSKRAREYSSTSPTHTYHHSKTGDLQVPHSEKCFKH